MMNTSHLEGIPVIFQGQQRGFEAPDLLVIWPVQTTSAEKNAKGDIYQIIP